jgi:hypothetical protein
MYANRCFCECRLLSQLAGYVAQNRRRTRKRVPHTLSPNCSILDFSKTSCKIAGIWRRFFRLDGLCNPA